MASVSLLYPSAQIAPINEDSPTVGGPDHGFEPVVAADALASERARADRAEARVLDAEGRLVLMQGHLANALFQSKNTDSRLDSLFARIQKLEESAAEAIARVDALAAQRDKWRRIAMDLPERVPASTA